MCFLKHSGHIILSKRKKPSLGQLVSGNVVHLFVAEVGVLIKNSAMLSHSFEFEARTEIKQLTLGNNKDLNSHLLGFLKTLYKQKLCSNAGLIVTLKFL